MLMILRELDPSMYNYRRYVISSGDELSARKAREFEEGMVEKARWAGQPYGNFDIKVVPRARKIHQSLLTTPLSALACGWACFRLLREAPPATRESQNAKPAVSPCPELILANGPATATILIMSCMVYRFMGLAGSRDALRCIYIESWARVKQLSLSGKILWRLGVCDRFVVQWPELLEANGRRRGGMEFGGALVG